MFQHDIAFGDFKDLNRRTVADKVIRTKHLILLKIRNMTEINVDLHHWSINFLIKKFMVEPLRLHGQRP